MRHVWEYVMHKVVELTAGHTLGRRRSVAMGPEDVWLVRRIR